MPEGDAVRRTANRLHAALAGKSITDWELRWPSLAASDHRGAATVEVATRGKHLLHRLDDGYTLHSHLRMEGSWRLYSPDELTRRQYNNTDVRAVVGARDATALGVLLGMLDVVPTNREASLVGHLGPDLLGADWDAERAATNLARHPDVLLGSALLDQRNLAGIGTIWLAETCFAQRVSPFTPVGELSDSALRALTRRAHALLVRAMDFPWSTSTGNPRHPTYVYARERKPCRVCRTPIQIAAIPGGTGLRAADRSAWFCPRCQGRAPDPAQL